MDSTLRDNFEKLSARYLKSMLFGYLFRNDFKKIRLFVMFIGYQRSGHSFIGALLDAHPNAAFGMEVDVLNLVRLGYSRKQIFYCLVRNAQVFHQILKNVWTDYSYAVPSQYQGRYTDLFVIGDKKGGKSSLRLGEDPGLFDRLLGTVKCPVRVLHVIRNPFDNISTMVLRHLKTDEVPQKSDFLEKIDLYFYKAGINDRLCNSGRIEMMDIYHEDFIKRPGDTLTGILDFIGLTAHPDYIEDCVKKVYPLPNLSRNSLHWSEDLKEMVHQKILKHDFLKRYSFDS